MTQPSARNVACSPGWSATWDGVIVRPEIGDVADATETRDVSAKPHVQSATTMKVPACDPAVYKPEGAIEPPVALHVTDGVPVLPLEYADDTVNC